LTFSRPYNVTQDARSEMHWAVIHSQLGETWPR
jgi:hypothetical protein